MNNALHAEINKLSSSSFSNSFSIDVVTAAVSLLDLSAPDFSAYRVSRVSVHYDEAKIRFRLRSRRYMSPNMSPSSRAPKLSLLL